MIISNPPITAPLRKTGQRLSSTEREELQAALRAGVPRKELAERFCMALSSVTKHAQKLGLLGRIPLGRPKEYNAESATFTCGSCLAILPRARFGIRRGAGRPVSWRCKTCDIVETAASRYKMPCEQARKLLHQETCDICGGCQNSHHDKKRRTMFIDHDHANGKVRGALCENCNSGLGLMQDSPDRLTELQSYLGRAPVELPVAVKIAVKLQWMRHLERTYTITTSQYQFLVNQQNGVCAVCKLFKSTAKFPRLLVDHCHDTNRIRGLLCYECNLAAGKFVSSIARIDAAKAYLMRG